MRISVQDNDFDLSHETAQITNNRTDIGAVVSFTGLVRDFYDDQTVHKLTLEHFPGMAEKKLTEIAEQAKKRWPLQDVTVIHRYGALNPGDQIVLVITASAHRDAAFDAARFLMDWLKTDAPFWKKQQDDQGESWVEARAEDDQKRDNWQKSD